MPSRLHVSSLTRAFFARFFESDAAGTHDLKSTFFWLLSFLAAPGFLLPILVAFAWRSFPSWPPPRSRVTCPRAERRKWIRW